MKMTTREDGGMDCRGSLFNKEGPIPVDAKDLD